MKVRDIMTKNVSYVTTDRDRDIVLRSVAGNNANQNVENVMSENMVSVGSDTAAHEAASLMAQNQIRRLPVVEDNKIVGMLSLGDLANVNIHVDEAGQALSSISKPGN